MERLDHLQTLGINCLELLPVQEFNEMEYYQASLFLQTGSGLVYMKACRTRVEAHNRTEVHASCCSVPAMQVSVLPLPAR